MQRKRDREPWQDAGEQREGETEREEHVAGGHQPASNVRERARETSGQREPASDAEREWTKKITELYNFEIYVKSKIASL